MDARSYQGFYHFEDGKRGHLVHLLLCLEWLLPEQDLNRVARVLKQYFQRVAIGGSEDGDSTGRYLLLHHIKKTIGDTMFEDTMTMIDAGRASLALGMAPTESYFNLKCDTCRNPRILHTFCLQCGRKFGSTITTNLRQTLLNSSNKTRLPKIANGKALKAVDGAAGNQKKFDVMAYKGLLYLGKIASSDSSQFQALGGDVAFLLRNIAFCCTGRHQQLAIRLVKQNLAKWMKVLNNELLEDHQADAMVLMEGVHVMIQMLRAYDTYKEHCARHGCVSTSADAEPSSSSKKRKSEITGSPGAKKTAREESSDVVIELSSDGPSSASDDDESDMLSTSEETPDTSKPHISTTLLAQKLKVGQSISDAEAKQYRDYVSRTMEHVHSIVSLQSVKEFLGFNPALGVVPLSDENYCNRCGGQWKKGWPHPTSVASQTVRAKKSAKNSPEGSTSNQTESKRCAYCHEVINRCIDYFALTGALGWLYVYLDSDFNFEGCTIDRDSVQEVVRLLPQVRCYQTINVLGETAFKTECYFVTHLIYTFSDWGQHPIQRALFAAEFSFIVQSMDVAIDQLADPEIVGEFLHCMKILQYHPLRDPAFVAVETRALTFLLDLGKAYGEPARWKPNEASYYDQYHTAYCAAIAMLPYYFTHEDEYTAHHIPSLVKYL